MPRVFDNIDQALLPAPRDTLAVPERADFCVGYFNLRGWCTIDNLIAGWQPELGQRCHVLIGMQRPPHEEVHALYQAAVKIAARHLHRHGDVIIGVVVGLGKTIIATTLERTGNHAGAFAKLSLLSAT